MMTSNSTAPIDNELFVLLDSQSPTSVLRVNSNDGDSVMQTVSSSVSHLGILEFFFSLILILPFPAS